MDIHALSPLADYFIICAARSDRQVKAIVEGIDTHTHREMNVSPRHVEGEAASGWVLMDYGDIVVHVFTPHTRAFYNLESLWKEAPVVLRMQ